MASYRPMEEKVIAVEEEEQEGELVSMPDYLIVQHKMINVQISIIVNIITILYYSWVPLNNNYRLWFFQVFTI
jgi:hypothetical protein